MADYRKLQEAECTSLSQWLMLTLSNHKYVKDVNCWSLIIDVPLYQTGDKYNIELGLDLVVTNISIKNGWKWFEISIRQTSTGAIDFSTYIAQLRMNAYHTTSEMWAALSSVLAGKRSWPSPNLKNQDIHFLIFWRNIKNILINNDV